MSKASLSIALAVHNEEGNIKACMDSVQDIAGEIIVVDGGSQDKTVEIVKKYTSNIIHADNPPIFHINKQKAVDAAKKDWILQLDADEIVPESLKYEIIKILKQKNNNNGYWIKRKNFYSGRWMRHGGMWPDPVIRLFRKGKGHFPCKSVHEQIEIKGEVGTLKNPLYHYPYKSVQEHLRKTKTYARLQAKKYKKEKLPLTITTFVKYMMYLPLKRFLLLYIRHKGVLDGSLGFVWSFISGLFIAQAYLYYWKSERPT